jgi:CRP-like cAMP-binding protein
MITKNQILARLSPDTLARLAPHLKLVNFERGQIIHNPGDPLIYLYFPIDCLFSITITMLNGAVSEVGMIGSREVMGLSAFMGGNETSQTSDVVQVAGSAMRIEIQVIRQELDRNSELRDLLLRANQAFLVQLYQAAACNALHLLEQRLGYWLLKAQERLDSDDLPLTQELLATMLGVRRAGVTQIALSLQERKLIQYRRGNIKILNQSALEATACECFATVKKQYDRLLGEK